MSIKWDLVKPEEPELNRTLKLFICLLLRVQKKSSQRRSQELGLSWMSTVRVLKLDLKLFPYHIQVKQKLTAQDKLARVEMCNWLTIRWKKMKTGLTMFVQWWGPLPSWLLCQFKVCFLGNWAFPRSSTATFTQFKDHSLVCNKFWNHNWTLLVWRWPGKNRYNKPRELLDSHSKVLCLYQSLPWVVINQQWFMQDGAPFILQMQYSSC